MFAPAISWTRDGRALLVSAQFAASASVTSNRSYTILIPLDPDSALLTLPEAGIASVQDWLDLPGARRIPKQNVLSGASPAQLFFYELTTIRNLYRVQLPD